MVHRISYTLIVSYCSCALEWWDVRTPGAILNVFDFLDYTYLNFILNFPRLLVSFASLAELEIWFPLWGERAHSLKLFCMYDKRFEI